MSKSTRLRLTDVNAAARLVGECRELWADPQAWRQHLLDGVCGFTGQVVGQYAEVAALSPHQPVQWFAVIDRGWRDEACRDIYLSYTSQLMATAQPFPGYTRVVRALGRSEQVAVLRQELCDDARWYRSAFLNEYRRPAFNDNFTMSFVQREGLCTHLGVHQDVADPPPTLWTKRYVAFVHRQIAPLVGTVLATERQRSMHGLTPRLRQTLDRLLAGDAEKEIADRLNVRPATAHEYVGKVYDHFAVNSRAALMAYFIRRQPEMR